MGLIGYPCAAVAWGRVRPIAGRLALGALLIVAAEGVARRVPLDPPGFFRGAMLAFAAFLALGVVATVVQIARPPYLRLERDALRTGSGTFSYRRIEAVDVADRNGRPYVGVRFDEGTPDVPKGRWSRSWTGYDLAFNETYGSAAELAARIRARQQAARPDA